MKYITIAIIGFIALGAGVLLAHGGSSYRGAGMMGYHHMMGYDRAHDTDCPMMMGMGTSADYLLAHEADLALSKTQIGKLEAIRSDYEKNTRAHYEELNAAMEDLHELLDEDHMNINKIRAISKRINDIESALRTRNIETYVTAKLLLTREQLKTVEEMGIFEMHEMHGYHGMR